MSIQYTSEVSVSGVHNLKFLNPNLLLLGLNILRLGHILKFCTLTPA